MRDDVIPVAGKFLRCLWAYRLDLPRAVFIDGRYSNATLMTILQSGPCQRRLPVPPLTDMLRSTRVGHTNPLV